MKSQNSKSFPNKIKEEPLLAVNNLSLSFPQYKDGFNKTYTQAIRDFELTIEPGEIVAVVGSSGSGKSLLADAILGILPENAEPQGTIDFEGAPLTADRQDKLRGKEISLIPQSVKALDPLMKTGKQVQSIIHHKKNKKEVQEDVFRQLGLPPNTGKRYPFELSGGMARRVLIATAMVSGAKLIIADEPTPGLDEKAKNETLKNIKRLSKSDKGVMFITHDIDAALRIADKVAVFYDGKTVEIADTEDFEGQGEKLSHPYTKSLWQALPENGFMSSEEAKAEAKEAVAEFDAKNESESLNAKNEPITSFHA